MSVLCGGAQGSTEHHPHTFCLSHPRCYDEHCAFINFMCFIKLRLHLLYDIHYFLYHSPPTMDIALILRIIPSKMGAACVAEWKSAVSTP